MRQIDSRISDRMSFIYANEDPIRATTSPDLIKRLATALADTLGTHPSQGSGVNLRNTTQEVVDGFSTKLFISNKSSTQSGDKVLITTNDPGSFNAARGIITELTTDQRCKEINVLASGVAAQAMVDEFKDQFRTVDPLYGSILMTLLSASEKEPYGIAFGTVSSTDGPEIPVMFGGKSNLGTRRLYYVVEGWSDPGAAFTLNRGNMDPIDGIFCNDPKAQRIIQYHLPEYLSENIFPVGTPVLNTVELDKSKEYRTAGRAKMGIDAQTWAFLYVGQPSSDIVFRGSSAQIQERTLDITLNSFGEFARFNPNKKLAFMLRTHPRDPQKQRVIDMLSDATLPDNVLKVIANGQEISMSEAAYSSDVIAGIHSTEVFLAPPRKRMGIFLGFEEPGLGLQNLIDRFGQQMVDEIQSNPQTPLVKTSKELIATLEQASNSKKLDHQSEVTEEVNYAKRILDIAFAL